MKETNKIKYELNLLGFRSEKNPPRVIIFTIFTFIMFSGLSTTIYKTWNVDVVKRITAVRDCIINLTCILVRLEILFVPDHIWSLIKMIETDFYKDEIVDNSLKIKLSNEKFSTITNNRNTNFFVKTTNSMLIVMVVTLILRPFFIIINTLFIKNDKIHVNSQELSLPVDFWIPENFNESLLTYILLYILTSTCVILTGLHASVAMSFFFTTTHFMMLQLKLYCISLKEIDKYVFFNHENKDEYRSTEIDYLKQTENLYYDKPTIINHKIDSIELKLYTKYLVVQHDIICRNIVNANRFVQLSTTVVNQGMCLEFCAYIYLFIEVDSKVIKILCITSALSECLIFYFYCLNGQNLIDEYDELRRCLAECSWVDKPQWFKKMLLTMMIRSNEPFNIKPFGLYVINLNNFVNVLKVSYSYLNLLRTLK